MGDKLTDVTTGAASLLRLGRPRTEPCKLKVRQVSVGSCVPVDTAKKHSFALSARLPPFASASERIYI